MTSLQQEALNVLSILHGGESIEAQLAGKTLVCRIGGEEGVWTIDPAASFIREPDGRITDLAELDHLVHHPEDFAPGPESDPPDDEYEPGFSGRSPYRPSLATDDLSMSYGLDDSAHSYAAVQRGDRWGE